MSCAADALDNMFVVILCQVMIGNEEYRCSCVRYVSQHSTVLIVGLTIALVLLLLIIIIIIYICNHRRKSKQPAEELSTDLIVESEHYSRHLMDSEHYSRQLDTEHYSTQLPDDDDHNELA